MDSLDVYNLLITSSIEIFSMVISLNSSIKSLEIFFNISKLAVESAEILTVSSAVFSAKKLPFSCKIFIIYNFIILSAFNNFNFNIKYFLFKNLFLKLIKESEYIFSPLFIKINSVQRETISLKL